MDVHIEGLFPGILQLEFFSVRSIHKQFHSQIPLICEESRRTTSWGLIVELFTKL